MATIATHCGKQVHQAHNRRDPRCIEKESHINPNGIHENWVDIPVKEAYQQLFGAAEQEYNNRQMRDDRKVNYYTQILHDAKKNHCYEMIVGVYGADVPPSIKKDILQDFVRGWNKRNPNMYIIGAYYHADEKGQPHVHIDYVPYADGYTRGLTRQTSYKGALAAQGYTGKNNLVTWIQAENNTLEQLCLSRGITVDHPNNNVNHVKTELYKAQKTLEQTKQNWISMQNAAYDKACDVLETDRKHQKLKKQYDQLQIQIQRDKAEMEQLRLEQQRLQKNIDDLKVEHYMLNIEYTDALEKTNYLDSMLPEKKQELNKLEQSIEELTQRRDKTKKDLQAVLEEQAKINRITPEQLQDIVDDYFNYMHDYDR